MTDRDAAVAGERERALRLAEKLTNPPLREPIDLAGWSMHAQRLARAFLAEAARAEALEEALERGRVFERRYQRALDEWPPTLAQWEHLESLQSAFIDGYNTVLSPSTPTEGGGDA